MANVNHLQIYSYQFEFQAENEENVAHLEKCCDDADAELKQAKSEIASLQTKLKEVNKSDDSHSVGKYLWFA